MGHESSLYHDLSICSGSTIFRGDHLCFNPFSEVGNPPVDTIETLLGTAHSPADITDQNMLESTLVSQRTTRVSL